MVGLEHQSRVLDGVAGRAAVGHRLEPSVAATVLNRPGKVGEVVVRVERLVSPATAGEVSKGANQTRGLGDVGTIREVLAGRVVLAARSEVVHVRELPTDVGLVPGHGSTRNHTHATREGSRKVVTVSRTGKVVGAGTRRDGLKLAVLVHKVQGRAPVVGLVVLDIRGSACSAGLLLWGVEDGAEVGGTEDIVNMACNVSWLVGQDGVHTCHSDQRLWEDKHEALWRAVGDVTNLVLGIGVLARLEATRAAALAKCCETCNKGRETHERELKESRGEKSVGVAGQTASKDKPSVYIERGGDGGQSDSATDDAKTRARSGRGV